MKKKHRYVNLYHQMMLIRLFEEKVEDLFTSGTVAGTVHTCIGQEATAVGTCSVLKKKDLVTSTHRGHCHFIAKGGDPKRVMAELFGKTTGYSGGRGGSQLMADYRIGFMGGNGIVGGSIPTATGMALQLKRKQSRNIVVCFIGDGAVNQGTFHESLNMAGLWKLPIIYLCENNFYAMSTPCSAGFANLDIAAKAAAYNMPGVRIDGNDLIQVRETVAKFADLARTGNGPALVECLTYRFSGHSRGDQRVYRTRKEEASWKRKEPIRRFRRWLMDQQWLDKDQDKDLKRQVRQEVKETIAFARESSYPDPDTLMEGCYS